ncbi:MAG: hypothetical protein AB8B91_05955 [Rubripirellula sp.]
MGQLNAANIAYFTVVDDERTGWTGGLLLLTSGGRPLEFQCTLPIRPSRAHEILFGPSLRDHLIGEVIGPLLVKKCRTPISLLCCDQPESLSIESVVDFPIAIVAEAAEKEEGPITADSLTGFTAVELAGSNLQVPIEKADAVRELTGKLADLPDAVEPFERIREAIKEAHSQIARANSQAAMAPESRAA